MRMKAFGAKPGDAAAAAQAGRTTGGTAKVRTRPPPKAAPALRKPRRSSRGVGKLSGMVDPPSGHGAVDRCADALISAAATDIAGHGSVDLGVARLRRAGEQRRRRHDLAR